MFKSQGVLGLKFLKVRVFKCLGVLGSRCLRIWVREIQ